MNLDLRDDDGGHFRVTLSAGLAGFRECDQVGSPAPLVALADQRLYRAKQSGRNRICGE